MMAMEPNFDSHMDDAFQDACDAGEKFCRFLGEKGWEIIVDYMKSHPDDQEDVAVYLYDNFPDIMIAVDDQFGEGR